MCLAYNDWQMCLPFSLARGCVPATAGLQMTEPGMCIEQRSKDLMREMSVSVFRQHCAMYFTTGSTYPLWAMCIAIHCALHCAALLCTVLPDSTATWTAS
jgi:hypothetical protein